MEDDDDFRMLRAHEALQFELDEFSYYLDIAMAAGERKMPVENPGLHSINIESEDGGIDQVSFTDIPLNRAMLAINNEVDGVGKFESFMHRFFALMDIVRDNKLGEQWIFDDPDDPGSKKMHPAVLDVARRMKLNKNGRFNTNIFRQLVNKSSVGLD